MKKLFFLFLLVCATSMYAQTFKYGDLYYKVTSTTDLTVEVTEDQTGLAYAGLMQVVIPNEVVHNDTTFAVTKIGNEAFRNCSSLTSVVIPEGVTYIGGNAFRSCSSLKTLTIPEGVNTIGDYAFSSCSSLTSVVIPEGVTTIGSNAFRDCSSLTDVTFPESLTTIGSSAFYSCFSLKTLTIPNSVTSVGVYAFYSCSSLTSVTIVINTTMEDYCTNNLNGKLYDANATGATRHLLLNGSEITTIDIPNAIKTIGNRAFYNCKSLTTVSIPNSVTTIGDYAFQNCSSISSYEIPNSVTHIGTSAFQGSNYADITIASGCNITVLDKAFDGIRNIYANATVPPAITKTNIVNSAALIIVPDNLLATYENADVWSGLAQQIVSLSNTKQRVATITAEPDKSALHMAIGESNLLNTTSLKVNGTINSYDIMLIRNKMLNLKYLDLSAAEVVTNEYEYYTGYSSHDNMLENYAFSELKLRVVHLPKNLIAINDCFTSCLYLDTVYCQPGLETIGSNTFKGCTALRHIDLKEGLLTIGKNAFYETSKLQSIALPQSTEVLDEYAFYKSGLRALTIPANVSTMGQRAFEGSQLQSVTFAPNSQLRTLPKYVFASQSSLKSIDWESANLATIDAYAFSGCSSLNFEQFPKKVKTIKEYAFKGCSALEAINLPPRVETIEKYAFEGCKKVDVIKISSSVRNIHNYAFTGCSDVTRVYTYTVEPTSILQQTFSCWHVANLYVPSTSYYNYYYNTQWSQFINLVEFDEDYDYFYLNGDYYLGGEYGEIGGEPDIDMNPGSGLIIVGNKTIYVGNVTYYSDGEDIPSIIAGSNLSIDTLNLIFPQQKGQWHFLTFPFDINREDIQCNSEFVVRYYDGQTRAENGSGGWQNVPVGQKMYNGQGYIFQAASNDTLKMSFRKPTLPSKDISLPLNLYDAENAWDANWNMLGNPYLAYYDLDSIKGFTYPIVTWNGTGYDTYRPGDDIYHFKPLEGFFIQNANLKQVTLPLSGRETRTQVNTKLQHSQATRAKAASNTESAARQLINITISDDTYTDRTRIVFNASASIEYEMGVDANKFMSTTAPVQIYSLGSDDEQYSINERPSTASGEMIQLGYYAAKAGTYTLSATRIDTTITIYDYQENQYVNLANGDYIFSTEAGYNNTRFAMAAAKAPENVTNIENISIEELACVSVYTITGQTIAENVNFATLQLPAGMYMVQTSRTTYKIVQL